MQKKRMCFFSFVLIIALIVFMHPFTVNAAKTITLVGKYDSQDRAVIKAVDTDARTIALRNHDTGRDYTLSYDNTSLIYNQYGRALSAKLLEEGTIADVTFLSSSKHLNSLVINKNAFSMERSAGYDLEAGNDTAQIDNAAYHLDDNTLILIDGKAALVSDVLSNDTIRVTGIGSEIYCVEVLKGHGYVSLSSSMVGDTDLTGAFLEIGDRNTYRVSERMLASVPEGTYKVFLSGRGAEYQTQITVDRDEETVIDTSQIEIAYQIGQVTFQVTPETATLQIDGTQTDISEPVELKYGTYTIKAEAEGYETVEEYLHVGSATATVEIDLQKTESDADDSSSAATTIDTATSASASTSASEEKKEDTSEKDATTKKSTARSSTTKVTTSSASTTATTVADGTVITGYSVYVDAPTYAELYLDGVYIGIVPTSFNKVTGSHTITLKRNGYTTKSYTIKIDAVKTDKTYAFPELIKETTNNNTTSASTTATKDVSGNSSNTSKSASTAGTSSSTHASSANTASTSNTAKSSESSENTSKQASSSQSSDSAGKNATTENDKANTEKSSNAGTASETENA